MQEGFAPSSPDRALGKIPVFQTGLLGGGERLISKASPEGF